MTVSKSHNCTDEVWRNCWFWFRCWSVSDRQKVSLHHVYDSTASMDINLTQDKQDVWPVNLLWLMPWYWSRLMLMANLLNGRLKLWETRLDKRLLCRSDAWMDEHTYQIVVRKDFLTGLKNWQPMKQSHKYLPRPNGSLFQNKTIPEWSGRARKTKLHLMCLVVTVGDES